MDTFDKAVQFVLPIEGGYHVDPEDPGGATKYGISKRQYPNEDIENLTVNQAIAIYRRDYWEVLHCDELPAGVALMVFDCAVNQGQPSAATILQQAVNTKPDGLIGPATLDAVRQIMTPELIAEITARRALRYATAPLVKDDGLGWYRRLSKCFMEALRW